MEKGFAYQFSSTAPSYANPLLEVCYPDLPPLLDYKLPSGCNIDSHILLEKMEQESQCTPLLLPCDRSVSMASAFDPAILLSRNLS